VPNPPVQKNRVKVYELRDNDWFDLGTGFCSVSVVSNGNLLSETIAVVAEDAPQRLLLKTTIGNRHGFQPQQDTLIVWTDPVTGNDMALSFQDAEGCTAIWSFVRRVQHNLTTNG